MVAFALPLLAMVVAGCFAEEDGLRAFSEAEVSSGQSQQTPAGTNDTQHPVSETYEPGSQSIAALQMDQCTTSEFGREYPLSTAPGKTPESWNPQFQYATSVEYEIYTCNRIGLGEYERGPIDVIYEVHTRFYPPEACIRGNWDTYRVVEQIYVSDSNLAQRLSAVLPRTVGSAEVQIPDLSGNISTPHVAEIKLQSPTTGEGSISFPLLSGPQISGTTSIIIRYAMFNQQLDEVLIWDQVGSGADDSSNTVSLASTTGTLLANSDGTNSFPVIFSQWAPTSATITEFWEGDVHCE